VVLLYGNDAARAGEISAAATRGISQPKAKACLRSRGGFIQARFSDFRAISRDIANLRFEKQFDITQKRSRAANEAIYEEDIPANYRLLIVLRVIVHPSH